MSEKLLFKTCDIYKELYGWEARVAIHPYILQNLETVDVRFSKTIEPVTLKVLANTKFAERFPFLVCIYL